MKKLLKILIILVILSPILTIFTKVEATSTPVSIHGNLSVQGTNIVDRNEKNFQLRGVSTHGIAWFPQYVNQEAFNYMRDNWKINCVRLAMYSNPNDGYNANSKELVKQGVNYAKNAGLYVIIDWHILNDNNPNQYKSEAISFFKEMANLYKNDPNVLYEICNEPNGDVQWSRDIKPYAEEVISEIRAIDNDAIIIVGTPTWSQDVDIAAQDPIQGQKNIVYTLHFYAATHKDWIRQKMFTALNAGLPIFVSEFGICDASGNGGVDINEANTWISALDQYNISYICWNLSNKNESSALISSSCNKTSGWSDNELSDEGKWLVQKLRAYPEESQVQSPLRIKENDIRVSKVKYQWNGTTRKPSITVVSQGITLIRNVDYKLLYKDTTNAGLGSVVIKGIGLCSGRYEIPIEIKPNPVTNLNTIKNDDGLKIYWKHNDNGGVTGYQIQYSKDSTFTTVERTKTIKENKKKITFSGLDDSYYIRVRSYVQVGDKRVYSLWTIK